MILRTSYFNQLLQLRDQDLIKVVTGIRHCGKSTLLHAFKQYLVTDGVAADAICFLNFEERENAHFQSWEQVYDFIIGNLSAAAKRYVFLDEVQLIPQFEKLVELVHIIK